MSVPPRAKLITIEYDYRGRRAVTLFPDAISAHRFYVLKKKQGKNPKIQS